MNKHFISAAQQLSDAFLLADLVYQSGFKPDYIIGVWRGGAPIAMAVQEYFDVKGHHSDHYCVRTSSYLAIEKQAKTVSIYGLEQFAEKITTNDSLLIVEDVFDTGNSMKTLLEQMAIQTKNNPPSDIRIASLWYKPTHNQTDLEPDYYLHQTDKWLVFPHEIQGLSTEEITEHKPELQAVMHLLK